MNARGRAVILRADAANLPLPDATVDLIVTSPPYWGLRSYTDGGQHYGGQIGDEPTPAAYIDNLITCTAEWVRVLKPGGSLFVNLGDAYANTATPERAGSSDAATSRAERPGRRSSAGTGIRPKSLYGLPWRYALACVDKLGLIHRRDIVWRKITALPESVTDRCRSTHEYLFHFTLNERYYAAVDRIRQPHKDASPHTMGRRRRTDARLQAAGGGQTAAVNGLGALPGSVWDIAAEPLTVPDHIAHARCCGGRGVEGCEDGLRHHAAFPTELPRLIIEGWSPAGICTRCDEGRRPYVLKPGLLRGDNNPDSRNRTRRRSTMDGGRGEWASRIAKPDHIAGEVCACTPRTDHPGTGLRHPNAVGSKGNHRTDGDGPEGRPANLGAARPVGPWREYHLDRWTPAPTRPAVVVDPFGGTGTTALVASTLGRTGVSVDRSADYGRLASWRTTDPGQIAKVLRVPKPRPQSTGQLDLFAAEVSA